MLLPPLIEKWEKIIAVKAHRWSVKKMRTRWGSCNIQKRRISLNLELVKKPLPVSRIRTSPRVSSSTRAPAQ